MADERVSPDEAAIAGLAQRWTRLSGEVHRLLGEGRRVIEVRPKKLADLERAVRAGTSRGALVDMVQDLALEPVEPRLRHFAERAMQIGQRFGKEITARVSHDGLRLDARHWSNFWQAFVHPLRNAIDHGIEPAQERVAAGKPHAGQIELRGRRDGDSVVIEIEDDGRGIAWDEVRRRLGERGLPASTRRDLIDGLFTGGLSTAPTITELSGRGLGMGALQSAVRSLGGNLEVDSEVGRGTRLRMRFPESAVAPQRTAAM
jgi:two-component system chemotaxis sensor kinase CheA